jgi:hypothetical protein
MIKWEYAVVELCFDGQAVWLTDHTEEKMGLDEMGERGWELVATQEAKGRILAIFKRHAPMFSAPMVFTGGLDEHAIQGAVYNVLNEAFSGL